MEHNTLFRAVPVFDFWKMVENGYVPPRYCFLIMKDGSQNWGYPMNWTPEKPYGDRVWFDHHRQGGHHNEADIEFVLVPVTETFAERAIDACKTVVDGYEGDGMENMTTRDDVFYRMCKRALESV